MPNDNTAKTSTQLEPLPGQTVYYAGLDSPLRAAAVVALGVAAVNSGASVLHLHLPGVEVYSSYRKRVFRLFGRGLPYDSCRLPQDLREWGENTPEGHDLIATRTLEALGFPAEGGNTAENDFTLFKALLTDAFGRLLAEGKPLNKATLTAIVDKRANPWDFMPSTYAENTLLTLLNALPTASPFWDEAYDFSFVDSPRAVQTLGLGHKHAHQVFCELHRVLRARAGRAEVQHPLVLILDGVCAFAEGHEALLSLAAAANTSIVFAENNGTRLPFAVREQVATGLASVRFAPPFYQGAAALGAELGVAAEAEKTIAQAAGNAVIEFSKQGVRLLPH